MPVDRGAIDAQLREIGEGERWWEHREFRDLPYILHADEQIRGIVNGKLLGRRRPRLRPGGQWLIVATDQRLICLKQERFARKQLEIAAGQISWIHQKDRLRSFQLTIETPTRSYRLRIPKEDAFRFSGALTRLVPDSPAQEFKLLPRLPGTVASLPGVAGIVSRLSRPPVADPATRERLARLEVTTERLQEEVERLQQQVAFMEDLLQQRAGVPALGADRKRTGDG